MNFGGHDFVGSLEFTDHEVVTKLDQTLVKPLVNTARAEGRSGSIKITAEQRAVGSKEEVQMRMRATFPQMTGYRFFLIHKHVNNAIWRPIYKSEISQAQSGHFTWQQVNILASDLAGPDDNVEQEVRIDFLISQKSGRHTHCGQVSMNLGQLREGVTEYHMTDKK